MLPPREAVEPRLHVSRRRVPEGRLDDPVEAWLDLRAAVDVRRHAGGDAAAECLLPAVARRGPARVDGLHVATQLSEGHGGLGGDGADLGVHRVGEAKVVAVGDAQSLHAPAERLQVIDARGGERVLVALVGSGAHIHHERRVGHGPRHGADVREAPRAARRVGRDAPVGGLQAEDPRAGGGDADRAAAVGPDVKRAQSRRRGRGRAAGRASRRPLEVPGIARRPEEEVVGRADPAEGRRVRLAEHDRAGALHALDHRGVLGGHVVAVERRAECRAHPLGHDEVLHREGHAVERPEQSTPSHQGALGRLRLPPRGLVGQRHKGVELRIDPLDPVEDRVHDLDRGDLLPPYPRRQLGRRQPAEPPVSHPRTPFVRTASSQDERWNTTILSSVISLIAYAGPSLPNPDSLRPP